jgi:hypothetical protein
MRPQASTVRITGRRPDAKTLATWLAAMAAGAALSGVYHAYDDGARRAANGQRQQSGPAWGPYSGAQASCDAHVASGDAGRGVPDGAVAASGPASPQSLLAMVLNPRSGDAAAATPDPYVQLVEQARQDPKFRQDLMSRLRTEADPSARGQLVSLLTSVQGADVMRFSNELMHSPDAEQRKRGLEMLVGLQGSDPQARQTLQAVLGTEADPAALSLIVAGLHPGDVREPQEVSAMLGQLQKLAQHDSPEVRSAAVLSSAQWGGAAAEPAILQALADPSPKVVQAAIDAVTATRASSDAAKDALLALAERGDMDLAMRQMALDALSNVNLEGARFSRFAQLRKSLDAQS